MKLNLIESIPTPFIFVTAPFAAAALGGAIKSLSGIDESLNFLEEIGDNAMLAGSTLGLSAFAVLCIGANLWNVNKGKNVV
jgi:hypothetical protein